MSPFKRKLWFVLANSIFFSHFLVSLQAVSQPEGSWPSWCSVCSWLYQRAASWATGDGAKVQTSRHGVLCKEHAMLSTLPPHASPVRYRSCFPTMQQYECWSPCFTPTANPKSDGIEDVESRPLKRSNGIIIFYLCVYIDTDFVYRFQNSFNLFE